MFHAEEAPLLNLELRNFHAELEEQFALVVFHLRPVMMDGWENAAFSTPHLIPNSLWFHLRI
jgi:hypothetical protein